MTRKFLTPVVLPADPAAPLEAATKQYVDNAIAGGGLTKPLADTYYVNVDGDTMTGDLYIGSVASNSKKLIFEGEQAGSPGFGGGIDFRIGTTARGFLGATSTGMFLQSIGSGRPVTIDAAEDRIRLRIQPGGDSTCLEVHATQLLTPLPRLTLTNATSFIIGTNAPTKPLILQDVGGPVQVGPDTTDHLLFDVDSVKVSAPVGGTPAFLSPLVSTVTTPDPGLPPNDFTVIIRVRGPLTPPTTGGSQQTIVGQWETATTRSWMLRYFRDTSWWNTYFSPAGTDTGNQNHDVSQGTQDENLWWWGALAVHIDPTTPANGSLTAYRSTDGGVTWSQVGSKNPATINVPFNGAGLLRIGGYGTAAATPFEGEINRVEMRTGTNPQTGTVLWRFDAADHPADGTTTVWTDPRGRTWTLTTATAITGSGAVRPTLKVGDAVTNLSLQGYSEIKGVLDGVQKLGISGTVASFTVPLMVSPSTAIAAVTVKRSDDFPSIRWDTLAGVRLGYIQGMPGTGLIPGMSLNVDSNLPFTVLTAGTPAIEAGTTQTKFYGGGEPIRLIATVAGGAGANTCWAGYYDNSATPVRLCYIGAQGSWVRMTADTAAGLPVLVSSNAAHASIRGNTHVEFYTAGTEAGRFTGSFLVVGKTTSTIADAGSLIGPSNAQLCSDLLNTANILTNKIGAGNAAGADVCHFRMANTTRGSITHPSTTTTAFNTSSDYRLKDVLGPVDNAVERLMMLKPCHVRWKENGEEQDTFIAHEVDEVVDWAVTGKKDAVDDDGEIVPQQLDASKLIPLLTAAVQELAQRVEDLERV